jgi:hypothetical protein
MRLFPGFADHDLVPCEAIRSARSEQMGFDEGPMQQRPVEGV